MLPDNNSKQIVRNYVMMPDMPQFSAIYVAAVTGVDYGLVRGYLSELAREGVVTRLEKRINGRVYYRPAHPEELEMSTRLYSVEIEKLCKDFTKAELAKHLGMTKAKLNTIVYYLTVRKGWTLNFKEDPTPEPVSTSITINLVPGRYYTRRELSEYVKPPAAVRSLVADGRIVKDQELGYYFVEDNNAKS